jgi:hypothetical protein
MPCEDCEKKNAGKVIVPDKWKAGAKNVERKINVNSTLCCRMLCFKITFKFEFAVQCC